MSAPPNLRNLSDDDLKNEAMNQKTSFYKELDEYWGLLLAHTIALNDDDFPEWPQLLPESAMNEALCAVDCLVGTLIPESEREKTEQIAVIGVWWHMRKELKERIEEDRFLDD